MYETYGAKPVAYDQAVSIDNTYMLQIVVTHSDLQRTGYFFFMTLLRRQRFLVLFSSLFTTGYYYDSQRSTLTQSKPNHQHCKITHELQPDVRLLTLVSKIATFNFIELQYTTVRV